MTMELNKHFALGFQNLQDFKGFFLPYSWTFHCNERNRPRGFEIIHKKAEKRSEIMFSRTTSGGTTSLRNGNETVEDLAPLLDSLEPPTLTVPPDTSSQQLLPTPSSSSPKTSATKHLVSGAISGLASCVLLQPLDLIKTRVQQLPLSAFTVPSSSIPLSSAGSITTEALSPKEGIKPSSGRAVAATTGSKIVKTTQYIVKNEGIPALWKGLTPTIARNVPGVALYFSTLSHLRHFLSNYPIFLSSSPSSGTSSRPKLSPTADLLSGAVARTSAGYLLMPVTVLKARFEASHRPPPLFPNDLGPRFSAANLTKAVGILWGGSVATAMRDAPSAGLFVLFYERTRRGLGVLVGVDAARDGGKGSGVKGRNNGGSEWAVNGTASAFSATLATLLTTPFDLLKTRIQLYPSIYTSLSTGFSLIWHGEKGWRGFWEGAGLRVARKAGSSAVAWTVYEALIKKWV